MFIHIFDVVDLKFIVVGLVAPVGGIGCSWRIRCIEGTVEEGSHYTEEELGIG